MKTKGLLVTVIIIFAVFPLHSQVAVNTTGADPEECAILDVSSADKGLLIPRVSITDVDSDMTPVENPVDGLLVFNIGTTTGIPKGFYYWNESMWNHVTIGSSIQCNIKWRVA